MNILPGDVLFVWGDGIVQEIIEGVTHGPSHCALFINENTLAEAQGGRTVGETALSSFLDGKTRLEVWGDPTLTDDKRQRMVEYAKTLYGLSYDYWLIPIEFAHFEFGIPSDWYNEHGHVICSSFVDKCSESINKMWTTVSNPAPVDELNGGVLIKKGILQVESHSAVS